MTSRIQYSTRRCQSIMCIYNLWCEGDVVLYRYVEVMGEFCEWFAQPEDIRGHFQLRTIYDQHSQRCIYTHLSHTTAVLTKSL